MNHIKLWACAALLLVFTAAAFAQKPSTTDQSNEIRCSGSSSTCKSGFIPQFASNGGSATVNDSIMSLSGSTVTASGNITATGNVTGAFVEGNASSGSGVEGFTTNGESAVFGQNSTSSSSAVPSPFGVQGFGTGTDSIGVGGSSNFFGNISHGIFGTAPIGVIGDSSSGYAVVAASDNSISLLAENNNGNDTAVIINAGTGPALFAAGAVGSMFLDGSGNLTVTGKISAGTKDFKIDHPLDPANKYLYHASVESSEMMNIYTGTAMLDMSGWAIVTLPDWFEAVNGDFRYQLTAIGAPAPNLHIAEEISNNQFRIAGGQPGLKVSWQVTGIRHDAYAKAHPLQVSVKKPEAERGYYIHPELYGAPRERGLNAAHLAHVMQKSND